MVIKVTSIFWQPKPLDIAFVGVKVKADLRKFTNCPSSNNLRQMAILL